MKKNIFSHFCKLNKEKKIEYVYKKIINGEYTILPESLSYGTVLKIKYEGNLNEDGYEKYFLYIPINSGIKIHYSFDIIEKYNILLGSYKYNDIHTDDISFKNDYSNKIESEYEVTILEVTKIFKDKIDEYNNKKIKKRCLKNERIFRTRKN